MIGEVASASGFRAPNLYITFSLVLPDDGWLYEDDNEELFCTNHDRTSEYNKRQSITQMSTGRVDVTQDPEDEDTTKFTSHFCFPFDYQFKANKDISKYF